MKSKSSFEEETRNIREASDKARSKMTTKEILLEISDNIAGSTPLMPEDELKEIAYQSSRIADALHDIKTAMFDIFTYGEGFENETIAQNIFSLSESLNSINFRQYKNERIDTNRDEEQNRATGDDSGSMPRKD